MLGILRKSCHCSQCMLWHVSCYFYLRVTDNKVVYVVVCYDQLLSVRLLEKTIKFFSVNMSILAKILKCYITRCLVFFLLFVLSFAIFCSIFISRSIFCFFNHFRRALVNYFRCSFV